MNKITIKLDSHRYDIIIGEDLLQSVGSSSANLGLAGKAAIISNPTVAPLYADKLINSLSSVGIEPVLIEIPDGEEFKSLETLQTVYDRLILRGLDRRSFIVALGGGVVGDLAGFAAATFLRGIPFIQVPTTLLAQVDSSVGGKTGIDHPLGKNLIGSFYQPELVVSDIGTLSTLSERHYLAGLAEVIKYGVVLDAKLFNLLENEIDPLLKRDPLLLATIVTRCCEIKAWVVEQDEKEAGLRAVLNYGHTLGHAFETLSDYKNLVHGEAVAIGMAEAARISTRTGYCSEKEAERIILLIKKLGLPTEPPATEREELIKALSKDKKNRSGSLQYVCNRGIGSSAIHQLTPAMLAEACYFR